MRMVGRMSKSLERQSTSIVNHGHHFVAVAQLIGGRIPTACTESGTLQALAASEVPQEFPRI